MKLASTVFLISSIFGFGCVEVNESSNNKTSNNGVNNGDKNNGANNGANNGDKKTTVYPM